MDRIRAHKSRKTSDLRYGIGKGKCKQEVNVGRNVNVDNVHAVGAGRISALTGLSKVTWLAFVCLGR